MFLFLVSKIYMVTYVLIVLNLKGNFNFLCFIFLVRMKYFAMIPDEKSGTAYIIYSTQTVFKWKKFCITSKSKDLKTKQKLSLTFPVNNNTLWLSNKAKSNYSNITVFTIHLEDVSLIDLFIALCIAGIVAHLSCGNLSNIQGSIISKVL